MLTNYMLAQSKCSMLYVLPIKMQYVLCSPNQNAVFYMLSESKCSILYVLPIKMQYVLCSPNQNAVCYVLPIKMQYFICSPNQNAVYFMLSQSKCSLLYKPWATEKGTAIQMRSLLFHFERDGERGVDCKQDSTKHIVSQEVIV